MLKLNATHAHAIVSAAEAARAAMGDSTRELMASRALYGVIRAAVNGGRVETVNLMWREAREACLGIVDGTLLAEVEGTIRDAFDADSPDADIDAAAHLLAEGLAAVCRKVGDWSDDDEALEWVEDDLNTGTYDGSSIRTIVGVSDEARARFIATATARYRELRAAATA